MAISDLNLTSAMRQNVLSLQDTTNLLDRTQVRLSTGKKVNTPIDNPLNFFLAKSFTDRASDISLSKDNMTTAIQTIKATDAGIKAISALIDQAKSIVNSAKTATTTLDVTTYAAQYDVIRTQIDNIANGTSGDVAFNGTNLLDVGPKTLSVDLGDGSSLTVTGFDATVASTGFNLTSAVTGWTGVADTDITASATALDAASLRLRTNSQALSSNLSIITIRQDFANNMINTLIKGSDNLILADLNEEGANMLMLQTRLSLGTSSLSIASQSSQSVLRLFG